MKRIFSILTLFLTLGVVLFAQSGDNQEEETLDMRIDKYKTGPENGVYTLNLEAFVAGAVTVTEGTAPADIVLVLDYSSSMNNNMAGRSTSTNSDRRINVLRSSVQKFVEIVKESNEREDLETDLYGGHRIAFVLYSDGVYVPGERRGTVGNTQITVPTGITLNRFIGVDSLSTTAGNVNAKVNYSKDTNSNGILSPGVSNGTYSGDAMKMAENILNGIDYSSVPNRSKVVVFFTDGEPGYGTSSWTTDPRKAQADTTIIASYRMKHNNEATVYSIGLFETQTRANQITTYMAYSSSDQPDATVFPTSGWVNVGPKYSVIVNTPGALDNVFSNIGHSAGGNYSAASASSVLVDVASTSFKIPEETDLTKVKVLTVRCAMTGPDAAEIAFGTARSDTTDITNSLGSGGLIVDKETGEVTVTNFDYGENWCGWDASIKNEQGETVGGPHGFKLVLQIPIMANQDAVGGMNVKTNSDGSKLIIKDKQGKIKDSIAFVSPTISLPVNIHITKDGLGVGESAKFKILRSTDDFVNNIEYVTSVFLTSTSASHPDTVYVKGLPSTNNNEVEYVYKVIEEDWSLGYTFQNASGIGHDGNILTVTNENDVTTDKFMTNPIKFTNTAKSNSIDSRLRAESKADNIFVTSGEGIYHDSKPRTTASPGSGGGSK